jgi:hypothetical protein
LFLLFGELGLKWWVGFFWGLFFVDLDFLAYDFSAFSDGALMGNRVLALSSFWAGMRIFCLNCPA